MAISEASGDFIAFLDDDFWLPNKLERQLSAMNGKNIGFHVLMVILAMGL